MPQLWLCGRKQMHDVEASNLIFLGLKPFRNDAQLSQTRLIIAKPSQLCGPVQEKLAMCHKQNSHSLIIIYHRDVRILFNTYTTAFQNPGGGERVLLALRSELVKRGHTVELYEPWNMDPDKLRSFDVIHYFSCGENSFWRYAKRVAPRVPLIVTPTLYHKKGLVGRAIALRRRLAYAMSASGNPFHLPNHWLPTTQGELELLRDYMGVDAARMTVLPNGVDERFHLPDPAPFHEKTGIKSPFVLIVARFDPVKNHLALIEAIAKIKAHLVLIGAPSAEHQHYYDECVQAAKSRERAGAKFTFLGEMSHDDPMLPSAYAAATVFALPSKFETFGISALEAALSGCQLVLTNQLEARDVFAGIANLVDPNHIDGLGRALEEALKKGRRNPVARELYQNYSWQTIAEKLTEVYQTLSK